MPGYDTKFAMHALRLGFQGNELLRNGEISLPIESPYLEILRDVRLGKYKKEEVVRMIDQAEALLEEEITACNLETDLDHINSFLVDAHQKHWRNQ